MIENENNSNQEIDEINDKNTPNLLINLQESLSSFNKSNNEDEMMKSENNIISNTKLHSSTKYISRNYDNNELKNNNSTSSMNQKFLSKITSMSTDPESIVGFHSPSPKKQKKLSIFKMMEKSKNKKKKYNFEENLKKKIEEEDTSRERIDAYGNIIKKKNKRKYKVSFIDEVKENNPLATIIDIESFKKFNFIYGMPKEEIIHKNAKSNCQCCNIF